MTLEDLERADTRGNYKGWDCKPLVKLFKYRQKFGLYLRYRHQIDNHNNRIHSPILLERFCTTKFWPDRNFVWFLSVVEMNTVMAAYMRITHYLLPQNNGNLPLPFLVVITLMFSCIIFFHDCICILTGSPG